MGVTYLFGIESHIICLIGIVSLISASILSMLYQGFYYLNNFFVNILLGFIWSFVMLNLLNMRFVSQKKVERLTLRKNEVIKLILLFFLRNYNSCLHYGFFFQLIQILTSFCIEFYNGVNQ